MTPDKLEGALAAFKAARIAIVGDLMLDEYVWGDVRRISPDAPVQVVEIRRRSYAIGGAGNVAHNIVAAGGSALLAGAIGDDAAGGILSGLLKDAGVDTRGVMQEVDRPTTLKTRVVARAQHIVRLDQERKGALKEETRRRLLEAIESRLPDLMGILVSDYAKGVVDARFVADLRERLDRTGHAVPVVVDPKSPDFSQYRGCTAITPNLVEAEAAARMTIRSDADLEEAGRRLRAACGADWVLITRGENGMALCGERSLDIIPAVPREVYDVTGAGDTVLAYFSLGLSTGLHAVEAARIANLAAGVKIGKVGTAAVGPSEILAGVVGEGTAAKIVALSEAASRVEHQRARGRRVVFTNGCFDLLHAGHVHLLEKARAFGDLLVVAVNSDASVKRLKGEGRPLVAEQDRLRVLAALDAVDLVLLFDEETPLEAIRQIHPDVLVKGGDYRTETIVGHELVLGYGGRVETIPLVSGRSTTSLIEAIKKSDGR
jgi:D-beta-D-heptose 7-phosphate kinase/D-beta-D-heptose 1-phosphate adenosyltransferase